MAEKNSHEEGKRKEDLLSYHSGNVVASEWQLSEGLMSGGDPEPSCSNANVIDAYSPAMWDQQSGSSNLGFSDHGVQQNSGFLNPLDGSRGSHLVPMRPGADSGLGALGWTPPNAMLKGGLFVPGAPGFVPQSLAHFPADVGFIERAARYSCFSGGNFSEIMSPFNLPESMNSYPRNMAPLLGSQEGMAGNGLKLSMAGLQSLNNKMNMAANGLSSMSRIPSHGSDMNLAASSKGAPMPAEHVTSDGNQFQNENNESLVRSNDEAKGNLRASSNESDQGEFSGQGVQEGPEAHGLESSSKGNGSKKRKRLGQNVEHDQNMAKSQQVTEVRKENNEVQNPTSITSKPTGKNAKQVPEASDSAKEDYIHIRARRGQATNSHSLAERVRREKISERMKFLQDLVPGCNKVTGKAVMLDEIINYVQSLQRQVEFLSMKLATVNPRLEFNIETLLSKEILQSRGGPSPLTFLPDMSMAYPSLQQGLHQSNLLHELGNSSEALRKSISSQFAAASGSSTFKDHPSQVSNVWEDELHNIVQMGLNSTDALSSQDISGMRSSQLALFSERNKDAEMSKGSSSQIRRASSATWTQET